MKTNKSSAGFAKALRAILTEKDDMSMRELGRKSGVSIANIVMITKGTIPCGPVVAQKLADGLGLTGEQRTEFLLQAAVTTTRGARGALESVLFDKVFASLPVGSGIKRVYREYRTTKHRYDLLIELDDGTKYGVDLKCDRLK